MIDEKLNSSRIFRTMAKALIIEPEKLMQQEETVFLAYIQSKVLIENGCSVASPKISVSMLSKFSIDDSKLCFVDMIYSCPEMIR
ncbi:hypothetical protein BpHYR1_001442 [Brachionus plicatilis]|uniref:Uncharacterized protein n=1 Tax=Brachionus plicatilis TaxID=10195 RepID=A0A3M7PVU6_BRAPC|nr:hypothetical protein BpHYR1_001442 [Brachionus plicatilis]